jgi:hypothetical protein
LKETEDDVLAISFFNGRCQQTEKKERVCHLCKIETLSRTRQQIMATTTSPRREINARLRQTGSLETDGFTVKSLLKNAKVSILRN